MGWQERARVNEAFLGKLDEKCTPRATDCSPRLFEDTKTDGTERFVAPSDGGQQFLPKTIDSPFQASTNNTVDSPANLNEGDVSRRNYYEMKKPTSSKESIFSTLPDALGRSAMTGAVVSIGSRLLVGRFKLGMSMIIATGSFISHEVSNLYKYYTQE
jgi:hypothetical protein